MPEVDLVVPTLFPTDHASSSKYSLHVPLPPPLTDVDSNPSSEETSSDSSSDTDSTIIPAEPIEDSEPDPHQLPVYSSAPAKPILYLPPLLSSLPRGYAHAVGSVLPSTPTTTSCLPTIDRSSLALHRALHHFGPVTDEYASVPYASAFNWEDLVLDLPLADEREWYCVAFRSKRQRGSDGGPLYEADRKAHEEAVQNGGLIMYWYGTPHPETGLNLATCVWESRQHALVANSRPHHLVAMRLAAVSYERYELERYRLCKLAGESKLRILPFEGPVRG